MYFSFAARLPQGGAEVWEGLCCPRTRRCHRRVPGAVPWPVPVAYWGKDGRRTGVYVLGMKGLVGGWSSKVSAAGAG